MPNATKIMGLPAIQLLAPIGPRKTLQPQWPLAFCSVAHRDEFGAADKEQTLYGYKSTVVRSEIAAQRADMHYCALCGTRLTQDMEVAETQTYYWRPTGYPNSTRTPDEVLAELSRKCHEHGTLLAAWLVQRKGNAHIVLVEQPHQYIIWQFVWWNEDDHGCLVDGHYIRRSDAVGLPALDAEARAAAMTAFVTRARELAEGYYFQGA